MGWLINAYKKSAGLYGRCDGCGNNHCFLNICSSWGGYKVCDSCLSRLREGTTLHELMSQKITCHM